MHIPNLRVPSAVFAGSLMLLVAACAPQSPPPAPPHAVTAKPLVADRVVVLKSQRLLELLRHGQVVESLPIALGREPVGPKERQGDGRTPEGVYLIDWRTEDTRYTRELHISYPDERDRERARVCMSIRAARSSSTACRATTARSIRQNGTAIGLKAVSRSATSRS